MKTLASPHIPEKKLNSGEGIRKAAKFFAVGFLALLALGFCTTSQRLNAG